MASYFDEATSPVVEPKEIIIGDFVQWRRTDLGQDYSNTTHTAKYVANIDAGGSNEITISGSNYNDDYIFTVGSSTTASYTSGLYHWQLEILRTSDSNRLVLARGTWDVIVDLDTTNADPRIHAEIMVQKIEDLLSGQADANVGSYSIAGRSLTKLSPQELMEWRDLYRREVALHKRKERIREGKSTGATILARF